MSSTFSDVFSGFSGKMENHWKIDVSNGTSRNKIEHQKFNTMAVLITKSIYFERYLHKCGLYLVKSHHTQ